MTTKNKIIIIAVSVILEIGIIVGSYSIGRYTRYKGTTDIGNQAVENVEKVDADLSNVSDLNSASLEDLQAAKKEYDALLDGFNKLQESSATEKECIDSVIKAMEDSAQRLKDFDTAYQEQTDSDNYAFDLMIEESNELISLNRDLAKAIETYKKELGEE